VEVIERRVAWLAIAVAIVFVFSSSGVAYQLGGIDTWELVVFIAIMVCLAGAGGLLVGSVIPATLRPFTVEGRQRFVFFAFVLWSLAVILIAVLASHAAIEAHRHSDTFGG
jgi:hypothetical protein